MKRPSARALIVGMLALTIAVLGTVMAFQRSASADVTGNDNNSGVISTNLGV